MSFGLYGQFSNEDIEGHEQDHAEQIVTHDDMKITKHERRHDEHEDDEQAIELTPEEIQEIGLETAVAGAGTVDKHISLAG